MKLDKFSHITKQKLILKHDEGAFLYFSDEYSKNHGYLFKEDVHTDLYVLVASCFEPIDSEDGVLTCGCGVSGCAGFYNFNSIITTSEIFWDINNGEVLFKFDKEQYINEVRTNLEMLMDLCAREKKLEYFSFNTPLKEDAFNLLYQPFVDESLRLNRNFLRNKIIIQPGENWIYTNEEGKKIYLDKDNNLPFYYTDIFGEKCVYYLNLKDLKKWHQDSKNKNTDWEDWNKQGIKFAKQIRKELPLIFDIWYQYQNVENNDLIQIHSDSDYF